MKLTALLCLSTALAALGATEEKLNQTFPVQPCGLLVVDVDFGDLDVKTNATSAVTVDVWRKVTRSKSAEEESFLKDCPVTLTQDGNTVTIRSHSKSKAKWTWGLKNRTEGKYTITVPAQFAVQLNTAGGGISVADLTGEVRAGTSGGGLRFARIHGPLTGGTSGGGVDVTDCDGKIKVDTSGGGISVSGGGGTLAGGTSGGGVSVKNFAGPAQVKTSGGGITLVNVGGQLDGSTSGGPISLTLAEPVPGPVKLSTSGGGVTVRAPAAAAFRLDAATSGGGVTCELPITLEGKKQSDRMKGAVNDGETPVWLRSSGGGIHVKRL